MRMKREQGIFVKGNKESEGGNQLLCATCGKTNPADVRTCLSCGRTLAQVASAPSLVMAFLTSPYLSVFLRVVVGAWFITAGWGKTGAHFEGVLMEYGLLPLALVPTVAKILPYTELIIGVCVLLGIFTRLSCLGMAGLLLIFIGAVSMAWAEGKTYLECGCNPLFREKVGPVPILIDTFLLLAAAQVFFHDKRILSLDAWLSKK